MSSISEGDVFLYSPFTGHCLPRVLRTSLEVLDNITL